MAADPSDIMNSIDNLYSQSLFCCLQLCPQRKFAYVCVGRKAAVNEKPKDPKANASESNEVKAFFVDKVSYYFP